MRTALLIVATMGLATMANAQEAPQQDALEGWPPVPPLGDSSGIANYCIHRNLLYSLGDVLCVDLAALICVPPATGTGGRAYWSAVPVTRGDINWAPPAHCGR